MAVREFRFSHRTVVYRHRYRHRCRRLQVHTLKWQSAGYYYREVLRLREIVTGLRDELSLYALLA